MRTKQSSVPFVAILQAPTRHPPAGPEDPQSTARHPPARPEDPSPTVEILTENQEDIEMIER